MNKRSMSMIVSALLLVALAVAASVLLYAYSMNLLGSLETHGGTEMKDQLSLESYDWTTVSTVTVHLRNVGSTSIYLGNANFYLNGQLTTVTILNAVLSPQSASTTVSAIPSGMTITAGQAYTFKVALADGAIFSYTIVCGLAS